LGFEPRLRHNLRHAHFLFPDENLLFVDEIIQKTFEWQSAYLKWEPLRKRAWEGEDLDEEEINEKKTNLKTMHEIEKYFRKIHDEKVIEKNLGLFLRLPSHV